jgi:hypothetical protein
VPIASMVDAWMVPEPASRARAFLADRMPVPSS